VGEFLDLALQVFLVRAVAAEDLSLEDVQQLVFFEFAPESGECPLLFLNCRVALLERGRKVAQLLLKGCCSLFKQLLL
jgi:hypothetical protein